MSEAGYWVLSSAHAFLQSTCLCQDPYGYLNLPPPCWPLCPWNQYDLSTSDPHHLTPYCKALNGFLVIMVQVQNPGQDPQGFPTWPQPPFWHVTLPYCEGSATPGLWPALSPWPPATPLSYLMTTHHPCGLGHVSPPLRSQHQSWLSSAPTVLSPSFLLISSTLLICPSYSLAVFYLRLSHDILFLLHSANLCWVFALHEATVPNCIKWRGTKEFLDEGERGQWKSWLRTQH